MPSASSYFHAMLRPIDQYFLQKDEPVKSCLAALRALILVQDPGITEEWKYGMPFYCFKGKMFCYLWVHKTQHFPYIGIVDGNKLDHPDLLQEKRARMKILPVEPEKDIPVRKIRLILKQALALRK
jgi:hypothetical protein